MSRRKFKKHSYIPIINHRRDRTRKPKARCQILRTHKHRIKRSLSEELYDCHYDVEDIESDVDQCDCGCGRQVTRLLSVLLQRFFTSKRRWLRSLKVPKWYSLELERIGARIQEKGYDSFEVKDLDLDIIQHDISRQQWVSDEETTGLVKQALVTFCVVNNVGYWQGLHDVAAALAHLTPKPTIGELSAILEKLVLNFATTLMRASDENIVNDASKISAKWRLMFKFFFPRAATEMEKVSDCNSWNINWFLTMGFYRFGCAHIVLAYVYSVILCSSGCMTAFMYQELGYLGVRGHMRWLMNRNMEYKQVTENLFDDNMEDGPLSKALTNSKFVHLDAEELINVSRNLYDTINGKDYEMAYFPLVKILKISNFFFNRSPMALYKNNDVHLKAVVQIGISDIFRSHEAHRLGETQSKQSQVINKWATQKSMRHCRNSLKISEALNIEILNIYLKNLNANVLKKSFIYPSRFAGGIPQRSAFRYNIVDVRSQYLVYGESLEYFFGKEFVVYLTQEDIDSTMKEANFSSIFTIWIIVTDDGYDNPSDADSLDSLDKGVDIYNMLTRSFSGVALLRGGYKALLRWKELAIPSKFNIPLFRRIMEWIPTTKEQVPKISIENVIGTFDDPFFEVSARLRRETSSRYDIFRNKRDLFEVPTVGYTQQRTPCRRHMMHMAIGNGHSASFNSAGGITVNGMAWHPNQIAKRKRHPGPSFIFYLASMFRVTNVDGVVDLVTCHVTLPSVRKVIRRGMTDFQDQLGSNVLVIREDRAFSGLVMHKRCLRVVTMVIPWCRHSFKNPVINHWIVDIINIRMVTLTLLSDESTLNTYLRRDPESQDDTSSEEEDKDNELPGTPQDNVDLKGFIEDHPFRVPLDQLKNTVEQTVSSSHRKIDTEHARLLDVMSNPKTEVRQLSACSDNRAHVFSRRIKTHHRHPEATPRPAQVDTRQQRLVPMAKPVFVPRNHMKRNQDM